MFAFVWPGRAIWGTSTGNDGAPGQKQMKLRSRVCVKAPSQGSVRRAGILSRARRRSITMWQFAKTCVMLPWIINGERKKRSPHGFFLTHSNHQIMSSKLRPESERHRSRFHFGFGLVRHRESRPADPCAASPREGGVLPGEARVFFRKRTEIRSCRRGKSGNARRRSPRVVGGHAKTLVAQGLRSTNVIF